MGGRGQAGSNARHFDSPQTPLSDPRRSQRGVAFRCEYENWMIFLSLSSWMLLCELICPLGQMQRYEEYNE